MSLMFTGIGVSKGIAIGAAHVLRRNQIDVTTRELTRKDVPAEVRRLKRAIKRAREELLAARDSIPKNAPSDVSAFIETHLLMLDDGLLSQRPVEIVKTQQCNAEAALQQQRESLAKVFGAMEDDYLATRVDDINHVFNTVIRYLDETTRPVDHDQWKGQIVIADDLTPADTMLMQNHGVAGFVTETGGQLSHTAILARSLGIPAIVGIHDVRRYVRGGEMLTLDGGSGMMLAEPSDEMLADFRRRHRALRQEQRELRKLIDTEAVTLDGVALNLSANVEIEDDLKAVTRVGADGIGLYRTEFMYMNRETVPDEQEHFRVYTKVLRALKGKTLTIRTADLGADKLAGNPSRPGSQASTPQARNPAMGMRGIRLCLNEQTLLVPQLRAILRASARGPVRILIPMLTNLTEVRQCLTLIASVKQSLKEENTEFDDAVPVGAMIEVPAAAIVADQFAAELDFLSIGTNDLIQYTLAIDRVDDQVNYLYDPLHPAVLHLIERTIAAGSKAKIPVSMCGEMAGDPRYVRLLLGLGLTDFSMPPKLLLEVKRSLVDTRRSKMKKPARDMMRATTTEARQTLLARMNSRT